MPILKSLVKPAEGGILFTLTGFDGVIKWKECFLQMFKNQAVSQNHGSCIKSGLWFKKDETKKPTRCDLKSFGLLYCKKLCWDIVEFSTCCFNEFLKL